MAYMSQEGYDKLVAELKRLESIERPKASAAIAEAADKGDLSENSEYDAVCVDFIQTENRIYELEKQLKESNNLSKFVRDIRKEFKKLASEL